MPGSTARRPWPCSRQPFDNQHGRYGVVEFDNRGGCIAWQNDHVNRLASRYLRPAYFSVGILLVSLGYIGFFVPGMPSTIFFILALAAFRRSSPRFENWLLNRPIIGPILRDWDESRAIRPRVKRMIVVVLWVSIALSGWIIQKRAADHLRADIICGLLVAVAIGVSAYVWTRPDRV